MAPKMSRRPRKSSACVTLVLIGAAALSGCGDSPTANRRSQYASREECLADWGDPKECEQQVARTGSGSHFYWGPSGGYGGYGSRGSGSGSSAAGHSISRGGFGSHGSSSS